jgi:hypothetical protein
MIDPQGYIDPDEGRDFPNPFYAEALPCESCGEPTFQGRVWNVEHQLWIAVDCSCNTPSVPTCPALIPALEQAQTVREVCRVIREHRATCSLCKPVEIDARKEPATVLREAA